MLSDLTVVVYVHAHADRKNAGISDWTTTCKTVVVVEVALYFALDAFESAFLALRCMGYC